MAEVRSLNLADISCTSLAVPIQTEISSSSGHEGKAVELDSKQQQKEIGYERSAFIASEDDDDVQVLFSAPRRRKRWQRLESSGSSFNHSQESQQSTKELLAPRAMDGDSSATDLGASASSFEAKSTDITSSGQSNLPTNDPMTEPRHEWLSNMTYESNLPFPFPSFPPSVPWWNDPMAPGNRQNFRWNPLSIGDGILRKRKHEEEFNPRPNHVLYRQSPQISPRSTPTSIFTPLGHISSGMEFGPLETLGRVDHNPIPTSSWPNLNWNTSDVGTVPYGSQNSVTSLRSEIVPSSRVWTNNVQNSPSIYRPPSKQLNIWTRPLERTSPSYEPKKTSLAPIQNPRQRPQLQTQNTAEDVSSRIPILQPTPQQDPSLETTSMSQSNSIDPRALQPSQSRKETRPEPPLPTISPSKAQTAPLTINPADIYRKPSLYSIPVWPALPAQTIAPAAIQESSKQPILINDQQTNAEANVDPSSGPNIGRFAQIQRSKIAVRSSSPTRPMIVTKAAISSPAYPQVPVSKLPDVDTFKIPTARAGRKHSPNLIVDIAETSQQVFPFSALAARHGVPVQKVFDTFSAIIQLPLLRNADDRRRHGELGKRRMRDYREAKKAMERAQEVERRERLRKMREERVKIERKRTDGEKSNIVEEELRKIAMNKAQETQVSET